MINADLLREIALDHIDGLQRDADAEHLARELEATGPSRGLLVRARRAVAGPLHALAEVVYPRKCLGDGT